MFRKWVVVDDVQGASVGRRAIVEEDGATVCNPSPMGEENARLISAAPELLDALKTWEAFFDTMPKGQWGKLVFDVGLLNDAFVKTRTALNKAKGGK